MSEPVVVTYVMLGMMRELNEMAQISPVEGPDKTA